MPYSGRRGLYLGEFLPGFQLQGAAGLNSCLGKRIGCGVHFGSRTCWHVVIDHYLLLDSYALTLYFMYCIYNNVRRLFVFHMSSNLVPCYDNFSFFHPLAHGTSFHWVWRWQTVKIFLQELLNEDSKDCKGWVLGGHDYGGHNVCVK